MTDRVQMLAGERQNNETCRAVQACNDYARLGPRRSLALLVETYAEMHQNAPSLRLATLKHWSARYSRVERAEEYDARLEEQKTGWAREVTQTGLALAHERVEELKQLAAVLRAELYAKDDQGQYRNLWLQDTKMVGTGDRAEKVNIRRFNTALVEQYRAVLDDLAKETGGRTRRTDVDLGLQSSGPLLSIVDAVAALRPADEILRETEEMR